MTPREIGDQPAFPRDGVGYSFPQSGMTYRMWLVGMAMQGLPAWHGGFRDNVNQQIIAEEAIGLADAVLEALAKESEKK